MSQTTLFAFFNINVSAYLTLPIARCTYMCACVCMCIQMYSYMHLHLESEFWTQLARSIIIAHMCL